MKYEVVIGLEVHAELKTCSKMFCACPVVDAARVEPNSAVCPVCAGMPGALPVVNRGAVELGLRAALALECQIAPTSLFARKNYFYPDLPKGYQISQYEYPMAENGRLVVETGSGERLIRIRRVHLEEDTGKLTHVQKPDGESYSLVDLNRAGMPLLEIVSEPDLGSIEDVRAYAMGLRAVLRSVEASSADMEKGQIRFEANLSLRLPGRHELGTRVEIKNLNSFRALEKAIAFEIDRQAAVLTAGKKVIQETLGWDESEGVTISQRSKEEAHDYRYFPEPDLPPLVVEPEWIEAIKNALPELPLARKRRLQREHNLSSAEAALMISDPSGADFFEECAGAARGEIAARTIANWISGPMFGWLNHTGERFEQVKIQPQALVDLLHMLARAQITHNTAKSVLNEMLANGRSAAEIINERGLLQVSDPQVISGMVTRVLNENPRELSAYLKGKETLSNWFFGQVMRIAGGTANPELLRVELQKQLDRMKTH